MIALIRPVLFSFLNSDKVKILIIDMLTKLAESTDNEIDDKAVEFIANGLFPAPSSNGFRGATCASLYGHPRTA